ncbi:PREDICTED: integrin beta-6-like [Amphimedon queenslandica]|uniref:Integrin beta n=1 Tax=Amphimedon queenslandica TaxID=400682 RepID=A0A1X7TIE9_AMPQE|nr:PREDICTED: integrin beta-6-like [Amphimedon queenslandica]|eukprot:XP_011407463.2 PREDICTED: integrin beta-6-like [Amphimedon queenslandica]
MRRTFYSGLLLVLWLASKIKAQSPCSSATTCNECYAIPNCAWCADRNFFPTKMRPRCEIRGILTSYCNVVEDIQSSTTLEENGLNSDNQISISSAKVYLRAGETQSLRVSVRPVLNFPIDFYFLLDSSSSLEDDLENIRRISQDISKFCS